MEPLVDVLRCLRGVPLKVSSVSSSGLACSLERLNCYERALPKTRAFLKSKFGWGKSLDYNSIGFHPNCPLLDLEIRALMD